MTDVHGRLTERITRERLKLEARRSMRPLVVVAIGGAIGLAVWLVQIANIGQYAVKSSRSVSFTVTSADGVRPDLNEVRFKGIPAGTITGLEMRGGMPVINAKVYKSLGPIYKDARATLRPNTALEDMYLDIVDRGSPSAGPVDADQPLPASQTDVSVQPEEIMAVFQPAARRHLYAVLDELGNGLADRGEALRESFMAVVPLLRTAVGISDEIRDRDAQTRRLVHNFGRLTGELARRDGELRELVDEGGRTMKALEPGSADLDATLHELPLTLGELDSAFTAVRGVVPDVDGALGDLRPVAKSLPGGLTSLRRLADAAGPAVRSLATPVARLVPLAKEAAPFSKNLAGGLGAIRRQSSDVDHITESVGACMTPLLYFFTYDASMAKFWDSYGPWPRGEATVNFNATPQTRNPWSKPTPYCGKGMPAGGGRP